MAETGLTNLIATARERGGLGRLTREELEAVARDLAPDLGAQSLAGILCVRCEAVLSAREVSGDIRTRLGAESLRALLLREHGFDEDHFSHRSDLAEENFTSAKTILRGENDALDAIATAVESGIATDTIDFYTLREEMFAAPLGWLLTPRGSPRDVSSDGGEGVPAATVVAELKSAVHKLSLTANYALRAANEPGELREEVAHRALFALARYDNLVEKVVAGYRADPWLALLPDAADQVRALGTHLDAPVVDVPISNEHRRWLCGRAHGLMRGHLGEWTARCATPHGRGALWEGAASFRHSHDAVACRAEPAMAAEAVARSGASVCPWHAVVAATYMRYREYEPKYI